jgi:hypothetical protein
VRVATIMTELPAGTVLIVQEADYLYGAGPVRIRVDKKVDMIRGVEWVLVAGTKLWLSDDREVEPVSVLVRVAAIQEQMS